MLIRGPGTGNAPTTTWIILKRKNSATLTVFETGGPQRSVTTWQ